MWKAELTLSNMPVPVILKIASDLLVAIDLLAHKVYIYSEDYLASQMPPLSGRAYIKRFEDVTLLSRYKAVLQKASYPKPISNHSHTSKCTYCELLSSVLHQKYLNFYVRANGSRSLPTFEVWYESVYVMEKRQ